VSLNGPFAVPIVALVGAMVAGCGNTTIDVFSPDRGLVGHWALDETQAGASVIDSSGFEHVGTPSANPPIPSTSTPPVRFGDPRSLKFDGTSQFVQLDNPPGLQISGEITLSAWINALATDGDRDVIAHGFRWNPDQEVSLRISSGKYHMGTWDGSNHAAEADIPSGDVGTWIHLCGVYDGTAYLLYRNGVQIGLQSDPTGAIPVDAEWGIGGRPVADPAELRLFRGLIDDVRTYSRALSSGEVAALARR